MNEFFLNLLEPSDNMFDEFGKFANSLEINYYMKYNKIIRFTSAFSDFQVIIEFKQENKEPKIQLPKEYNYQILTNITQVKIIPLDFNHLRLDFLNEDLLIKSIEFAYRKPSLDPLETVSSMNLKI